MSLVRALLIVGLVALTIFAVAFVVWMREGADCSDDCSVAVDVTAPLGWPSLVVAVLAFAGAAVAAVGRRRRETRRR